MSDTDLLFMPAVKAAALIRVKKLSPVDYVDTVLKAIERAQPKLNCFRVVMAEEARRDAKKAEEAVARGDKLGPLHGVPVSIKDLVDVKGVHTRHGSAIFEDNVAQADDILVKRLRAAGATPTPPHFLPPPRPLRPPLIDVCGLGHRYPGGHPALAEVSLAIRPGEFLALVGRNGSGKTTLAKHLNGLLEPSEGAVRLEGHDVRGLALEELAQRVGYVFQDPDHQLFAATVEEEVAFGPRNLGLDPAEVEVRVAEALAAVGLVERDADPFLLDKGVRQRLAVAAVLALRPDVLVLDEPTTGLDFVEQQKMMALLRARHAAGQTIVIITHTPWVIAEYAERVVLLAGGRLRYDGPPRQFFADDELLAAAAFRAPDVTRLGRLLGCTPLSVAELVSWMPGRQAPCP